MAEMYNDRDYFDRMFASIDDNFHEVKARLDKLNGRGAEISLIFGETYIKQTR